MTVVNAMSARQISVGVVADSDVLRDAVIALIDDDPELRFVGSADSAAGGRNLLRRDGLQVLVVSLALMTDEGSAPGLRFISTARRYRKDIGILSLKRGIEEPLVRATIDAGADACCLAGAPESRLLRAIKAVSVGATWLDPEVSAVVFRSRNPRISPTPQLTGRQRKVLQLITEGYTNVEMAKLLKCTPGTIHTHVMKIYHKLDVHDRASVVIKAIRLGLISDNAF